METSKRIQFYEECVNFWHRMGIQKEDNLIALSLADLIAAKLASDEDLTMWHEYYKEIAEKCIATLSSHKFNKGRGRVGCFKCSGL